MNIKEKAKNICKNYGGYIVVTTTIFGAYFLGAKVGTELSELQMELGLRNLCKMKPEIETLLWEGIEELKRK